MGHWRMIYRSTVGRKFLSGQGLRCGQIRWVLCVKMFWLIIDDIDTLLLLLFGVRRTLKNVCVKRSATHILSITADCGVIVAVVVVVGRNKDLAG